MKDYTLAKLHKPKTGSDWYIYYTFRNPETGEMELFKERKGINRLKSVKERKHYGAIYVNRLNQMLENGWSPYIVRPSETKNIAPLSQVIAQMLAIKQGSVRVRSYQHYKFAIDLFKEYASSRMDLPTSQFRPNDAQGYSDHLILVKRYSGKSHNNQIANMKVLFNMMIDREIIDKNPFQKVKKKPEAEGRILYYDRKTKDLIGEYLKRNDHPMYVFVQLIYYCFIRPNEIMQLQVKHLDLENGNITIPASASKNGKSGLVPVPEKLLSLLKERYSDKERELYLFGRNLTLSEIPVHRNRASQSHKEVLKDLKISNEHVLYDWKHTGARDFILAGNNPYELMRRMRHYSLDQTMVYLRSLGVSTDSKADPNAWIFLSR